MSTSNPPPRTAAALASRRRATEAILQRIRDAVTRMQREQARVTVAAVARRADVSRTFLYQHPQARALLDEAATRAAGQRVTKHEQEADRAEAAWRERALNAEDALRAAQEEIRTQRHQIAEFLGRIRDLELDLPEEAVQRTVTENTALKQRVRQLTQDNQRLEERLKGARDNNRFLDKRIADLEAELATHLAPVVLTSQHEGPAQR